MLLVGALEPSLHHSFHFDPWFDPLFVLIWHFALMMRDLGLWIVLIDHDLVPSDLYLYPWMVLIHLGPGIVCPLIVSIDGGFVLSIVSTHAPIVLMDDLIVLRDDLIHRGL